MFGLSESTLIQAGGIATGLASLTVLFYIAKGHRKDTEEFTKILGNHLHDAHEDKQKDLESRERHTVALTRLVEKIDNLK